MAGVKGRSGGARANSGGARENSGGARAGAGRKPAPKPETVVVAAAPVAPGEEDKRDTLRLLQDIAFGVIEVSPSQLRAAIAAVQYTHTKRHDGGKKEEQADKAKKAHSRFGASAPPKLFAVANK